MLERASACLDSGVRLSLRAQRRAPKSRRLLHSNFWHHAAGDLDLPACLITSACPPPQPDHGSPAEPPQASSPLDAPFLDFLYPAQTLAYMSRVSSSHLDRIWDRRAAHKASLNGLRGYSSMTAPSLASRADYEELHQPSSPQSHLQPQPQQQQQQPRSQSQSRPQPQRLSSLPSLLKYSEELGQLMASQPKGPVSDAAVKKAWDLFVTASDMGQFDSTDTSPLIEWLGQRPTATAHAHIINLFGRLPESNRSSATYRAAVAAYLATGRIQEALDLHAEALTRVPHLVHGADLLMLHAISHNDWGMALEIYRRHLPSLVANPSPPLENSTMQDDSHKTSEDDRSPSNLPPAVRRSSPPELWTALAGLADLDARILRLARYYKNHLDEGNRIDVLGLLESIWAARLRFAVGHPSFVSPKLEPSTARTLLRRLFIRMDRLQLPSTYIYESCLLQLVNFKMTALRDDTSSLVNFIYKRYKKSSVFQPSWHLLSRLIAFWKDQSLASGRPTTSPGAIDLDAIVHDMEHFHGRLDNDSFAVIMACMARYGDVAAVERYAQKYRSLHFQGLSTSATLWPLVYVHAKISDPSVAKEQLQRIREEFDVEPDLRCWNIVLYAYEQANDLEGALAMLEEIIRTGHQPDAYTYSPLLTMYAKQGDIESTTQLLERAKSHGVRMTVHMLNSILVAHVNNNNDMARAEESLEDIIIAVKNQEAKGTLTMCFNTILTAHALNRNIDSAMRLYRRMKNEGIKLDANTYGALIQVLCFFRQTNAARKIVRTVMRNEHIRPNASHYAIVMAGYVNQNMYQMALDVASDMEQQKIKPTASTRAILLKAKTLLEHSSSGGDKKYDDESDVRAPLQDSIDDFVKLSQSKVIARPGTSQPAPGFRGMSPSDPLDASFLVYIHGKRRAFEAAHQIFRTYIDGLPKNANMSEEAPPLRLINALMSVHFRAREYAEVDRYWELARSQADAICISHSKNRFVNRSAGQMAEPGVQQESPRIPPAARFLLNRPLRYYLASQFSQPSVPAATKMTDLISSLLSAGFEFDNRTWNAYIMHLCRTKPPSALLAFTLVEKYLMPNWPGWTKARTGIVDNLIFHPKKVQVAEDVKYMKNATNTRYRRFGELVPQYRTMVYLANALLELRSLEARGSVWSAIKDNAMMSDEKSLEATLKQVGSLKEIRKLAPKTVHATQTMPTVYDRLQQSLLRVV